MSHGSQAADQRATGDIRRAARAIRDARIRAAVLADPELTARQVAERWGIGVKHAGALIRGVRR